MLFSPREVLVPFVAGNGGVAVLGRIVADGGLPAPHPAKLEPEISELLSVGLYGAGQAARAAVRRLRQRYWPTPRATALSVVNPGELLGLAEENARSAELGLALALLLFQSQAPIRCVLATGTLASVDGGQVRVASVHHMRPKFAAVEKHYRQAGIARPPTLMLVPETDPDGYAVAKRYASEIRRVAALGIAVQPVSDLKEAAERIGALHPAWPTSARAAAVTAPAVLVVTGLVSAAVLALRAPIPLAFADAVAVEGGAIQRTPFRAKLERNDTWTLLPQCRTQDGLPAYRPYDQIMFALRTGEPTDWISRQTGLHIASVTVAPGLVKVLPIDTVDRSYAPGEVIFRAWPLIEPVRPGPVLIAFLARRLYPFNRERLQADLDSRLRALNSEEQLNAARLHLEQIAPAAIFYYLREIGEDEQCI
jgi:hypothetical protein